MAKYPEILGDITEVQKPTLKTQLMNSIRAACKEGVKKKILENKYGNTYKLIPANRRPAPAATETRYGTV